MSFKILYAASNRAGAKMQLFRFLQHIQGYDVEIKIAGYRKMKMHLDWTLDALNDIMYPSLVSIDNENFEIYYQQIRSFKPDLVISDLEPYTSYAAQSLDITTWQVSPLLLHIGRKDWPLTYKNNYLFLLNYLNSDLYKNIISNSNKNFVYSFAGDFANAPKLTDGYEWVRPYYYIGAQSQPCQHSLVVVAHKEDKKITHLLKQDDVIMFADPSIKCASKNIYDTDEYICNIVNSNKFVSQGTTDVLADAIYNNIAPFVIPDLLDAECALNLMYLEQYEVGCVSYDGQVDKDPKKISLNYDENISFLDNKIEELIY